MLPFDSDRWTTLTHAYGTAEDVPDLLRAVAANPSRPDTSDSAPWGSLWSALCHQGDVHVAAFAAVPHLLNVAQAAQGPCVWDFLGLPASVEAKRLMGQAPEVPPDLAGWYSASWDSVPAVLQVASDWEWDHVFTQAAAALAAAAKGHGHLAEAMLELGPRTTRRFLERLDEGEI